MIFLIDLSYIIYIFIKYNKYKYLKKYTYIIIYLVSLNTFKLKYIIILILNIF